MGGRGSAQLYTSKIIALAQSKGCPDIKKGENVILGEGHPQYIFLPKFTMPPKHYEMDYAHLKY